MNKAAINYGKEPSHKKRTGKSSNIRKKNDSSILKLFFGIISRAMVLVMFTKFSKPPYCMINEPNYIYESSLLRVRLVCL